MQTLAALSLKGGVGKTTVALGLASAALRRGVRALLVDLDPQCNATATLDPPAVDCTLADVLADPRLPVVRAAIAPTAWHEDLDVLVGSELVESMNEPVPDESSLAHLARALEVLAGAPESGGYELVILDCPPSLGRLTRSALTAATGALLVTEATMYAVSGAQRAFEAIESARVGQNPELRALGVLVNRFRHRSQEHHYRMEELRESFGSLVLPVALPDQLAVQQAAGACVPIHEWQTPGGREVALAFNLILARALRSARRGRHHLEHPEADEAGPDDTGPDDAEAGDAEASDTAAGDDLVQAGGETDGDKAPGAATGRRTPSARRGAQAAEQSPAPGA